MKKKEDTLEAARTLGAMLGALYTEATAAGLPEEVARDIVLRSAGQMFGGANKGYDAVMAALFAGGGEDA